MAQKKAAKKRPLARAATGRKRAAHSCGLCGESTKPLMRTECCGQWICDDEHEYVMFSYAHNSCHRNHSRYTLCSSHYNEGHAGAWQECQDCWESFETEMYVWYATNEYNFVKLENPPTYEPTKCARCKRVIKLAEDGYSMKGGKCYCYKCTDVDLSRLLG